MVHIWAGVYIPPDEDAELIEVEDTKEFVKHRFAKTLAAAQVSKDICDENVHVCLLRVCLKGQYRNNILVLTASNFMGLFCLLCLSLFLQVPFQLHVIVGPTDPEAVARLITKKVQDINAEAIIIGKHAKGKLKEYWLGSVTKALVRLAPAPIAVVPNI